MLKEVKIIFSLSILLFTIKKELNKVQSFLGFILVDIKLLNGFKRILNINKTLFLVFLKFTFENSTRTDVFKSFSNLYFENG